MPTGPSDNAVKFTFDGPNNVTSETLNALTEAVTEKATDAIATPAISAVEAAPAPDATPLTAAPEVTPAAPPASPDELRTFKITVDGQEMEVTEADLKAGHMRHRDYTQKTQKLAEHQRAIDAKETAWQEKETAYQRELSAIDAFLQNQAAIDAYRQKAFGSQLTPPVIDPTKPLTQTEVADIARYNAEQVRITNLREMETRLAAVQKASEDRALETRRAIELEKLEVAVDAHIHSLLDKYPVLKKFEDIDEELIGMASKFAPKTLDDARARLTEAAERKAATIRAIADEEKKTAAVAAAEIRRTSTEPPGGTAPKPAPGKKLTLDHRDRSARIDAGVKDIEAFLNAQS